MTFSRVVLRWVDSWCVMLYVGDAETVDKVTPLFEKMGKNIRHMGAAGVLL